MTTILYTIIRDDKKIELTIEAHVIPSISPLSRGGFDPGDPVQIRDVVITDEDGNEFDYNKLSSKEISDIDYELEMQAIENARNFEDL